MISLAPIYSRILAGAAGLAMIVGGWERVPVIGPAARIERARGQRDAALASLGQWQAAQKSWQTAYERSEGARVYETAQARAGAKQSAEICASRLEASRRSSAAIDRLIIPEPNQNALRLPVRRLLDAGQLRDALGAADSAR